MKIYNIQLFVNRDVHYTLLLFNDDTFYVLGNDFNRANPKLFRKLLMLFEFESLADKKLRTIVVR